MTCRPALAWPLLLVALLTGCSNFKAPLILKPLGSEKEFSQKFTQTYAALNEDGSFEFLLLDNDAQRASHQPAGAPLKPAPAVPLRQLVHVKIHWLPMHGDVSDTTPANATVDWYIFSDAPDHQSDLLLYSGAGYALAHISGHRAVLDLKSARLIPQIVHGLTDPLGPFRLSGKIAALLDPNDLHRILNDTRSRFGLPLK
jgi:hypothetical protein